eukprot:SAG31_NODE_580_length_13940_cov_16.175349_4_plen_84_part_00
MGDLLADPGLNCRSDVVRGVHPARRLIDVEIEVVVIRCAHIVREIVGSGTVEAVEMVKTAAGWGRAPHGHACIPLPIGTRVPA